MECDGSLLEWNELCVSLYIPHFCACVCVSERAGGHAYLLVHVCTYMFACVFVSVWEMKEDWQWSFRGHAYGGLAVMSGCGEMAQASEIQLLIMTDLHPSNCSLSFFHLNLLCLVLIVSFACNLVASSLMCCISWCPYFYCSVSANICDI